MPIFSNDEQNPLLKAIFEGDLNSVKSLHKSGKDINEPWSKENQYTYLGLASDLGKLEIVKYLVESGAKVNSSDVNGGNPLLLATIKGRFEVVKYLVEKGADVNHKDKNNISILNFSLKSKNYEIAKYLLEKGADPNASNLNGFFSLNLAIILDAKDIVAKLIEKGADLKKKVFDLNPAAFAKYASKIAALEEFEKRNLNPIVLKKSDVIPNQEEIKSSNCSITNQPNFISIQTKTYYENSELYDEILPKPKSKELYSISCDGKVATLLLIDFENKEDARKFYPFFQNLIWGSNESNPYHPERIFVYDNFVLLFSSKTYHTLDQIIMKKVRLKLASE